MFTTESDSDNDSDIVYMGKSPTPATTRPSLERDVSEALPESVVDLTLDEDDDDDDADLDTRRAGKRQRRHSRLERVGAREGRTVMRLVGEPFADQHGLYDSYRLGMKLEGRDRRWRELHTGDKVIEVDTIVICGGADNEPDSRGLVRYISERRFLGEKAEITAHVHWLTEACGGERDELFLKHGACQDLEVSRIRRLERVWIQGDLGQEGEGTRVRHVFESAYNAWRDIKRSNNTSGAPDCDSCLSVKSRAPKERQWHRRDCVFLDESTATSTATSTSTATAGTPWRVARIVEIAGSRCRVQLFDRAGRSDDQRFMSSRRLILTATMPVISLDDILDQAFVSPTEEAMHMLPANRAFFCDSRRDSKDQIVPLKQPISNCEKCTAKYTKQEVLYREFRESVKLPAIDYYSGGGGGIVGASDYFEHKHAVEKNKQACETLMHNFPAMNTMRCKVGAASRAALEGRSFRQTIDGVDRKVPGLPRPGSMALALAGPPCQGHTGANHHNQRDDPRNDELFITIAEIDRLRPDIFILENVPGMKQDKAEVNQEETKNFAAAAIKAIRRVGYQCRLVLLDSRSFGSPQNRVRLFIICARDGVPLPSIPEPTHANPALSINLFISGETDKPARAFYVGSKGVQGSGPYPAVTVRDALSDMPAFEYDLGLPNPRRIPRFAAKGLSGQRVGYDGPIAYATQPQNEYQARQRQGAQHVLDHYTPTRSDRQLELVKQATLMVGQTSNGLQSETHGKYRRINPDRGATTLLTDSAPGQMYTGAIHWDQRRTLTVAERKRLQGVPDSYVLKGTVQEALHGHIHRTVFFPAWLEMGKPMDFFRRWRERHPI